jgi:hypothetical protein
MHPDAVAGSTAVAADNRHVDVAIERRTYAPRGRGGVVAEERSVAAGKDR